MEKLTASTEGQFKTTAAAPAMICSHVEWRVCDLWMEPTVHADT